MLLYSKRISDVLLSGVPILIKEDPIGFYTSLYKSVSAFSSLHPAVCRLFLLCLKQNKDSRRRRKERSEKLAQEQKISVEQQQGRE